MKIIVSLINFFLFELFFSIEKGNTAKLSAAAENDFLLFHYF